MRQEIKNAGKLYTLSLSNIILLSFARRIIRLKLRTSLRLFLASLIKGRFAGYNPK